MIIVVVGWLLPVVGLRLGEVCVLKNVGACACACCATQLPLLLGGPWLGCEEPWVRKCVLCVWQEARRKKQEARSNKQEARSEKQDARSKKKQEARRKKKQEVRSIVSACALTQLLGDSRFFRVSAMYSL